MLCPTQPILSGESRLSTVAIMSQRATEHIAASEQALTRRAVRALLPALLLSLSLLSAPSAWGQLSEAAAWAVQVRTQYRIVPNLTYLSANNWEAKLDLYLPDWPQNPAVAPPAASVPV